MKQVLVLLSVLTLAACGTQSTEIKADSTKVAVDTAAMDTTKAVADTVK